MYIYRSEALTVRADYSKTKRKRFIDLSGNTIAWLGAYRQRGGTYEGPIVTYGKHTLSKRRHHNRIAARVTRWPNSAMRHSYCSYWLAMHKDINKLVLQSGHTSVDTMWRHYHRGTTEAEAKKFWAIMPPSTASNTVRITA